jgi:hypothetical protein
MDLGGVHAEVVRHLQKQQHAAADSLLAPLGFRYRLSPQIWSSYGGAAAAAAPAGASSAATKQPVMDGNYVKAFDNVLAPTLLAATQHAFGPAAAFWSDHDYPTPGFFSYYCDLEAGAFHTGVPGGGAQDGGSARSGGSGGGGKKKKSDSTKATGKGGGKKRGADAGADTAGPTHTALQPGVLASVLAAVQPLAEAAAPGVNFGGVEWWVRDPLGWIFPRRGLCSSMGSDRPHVCRLVAHA